MDKHFRTQDFEVLVGAAGVLGKGIRMMISDILEKGGSDMAKSKLAGSR